MKDGPASRGHGQPGLDGYACGDHVVRHGRVSAGCSAIALAVALASCSSAPAPPPPTSSAHNTPSAAPPSIAPTATPSAAPTPTSIAPPVAAVVTSNEPTCAGAQLQIAYWPGLSGGGAGTIGISLAIWNHGKRPCKLKGWATLQFLNSAGGLVPTHWVETTSIFTGSSDVLPIAVSLVTCTQPNCTNAAPAAYISFDGDDVFSPCETADGIRVNTPGSSTPVFVNLRSGNWPHGQTFCSAGKIFVLPVQSPVEALGPTLS